jgi:YggT family protein
MRGILLGLAAVLDAVFSIYKWIIVLAVLASLVNADPYNGIVRALRAATEPVFSWFRRRLPFLILGAWDLSPFAVFLVLIFLDYALIQNLRIWASYF